MKRKTFVVITVFIILYMNIIFSFAKVESQFLETGLPNQKVIMIVVNRVTYDDLQQMDFIQEMMEKSYVGLMNTRASGSNNEYKSYATLGMGTRGEATYSTSFFQNANDEVAAKYQRRTGVYLIDNGGVINPFINQLIRQNNQGEYGAIPGLLGGHLRDNGYKTAVVGNSDTNDAELRSAGLIAMDRSGYIDYGNVGALLNIEDDTRPFGIRTDFSKLLEDFKEVYGQANFIVVEAGEITRLERYRDNLNEKMYVLHRQAMLNDVDAFIEDLMNWIEGDMAQVMIIAPYPSDDAARRGDRLTPIILYDGENRGVLWSETTRRLGILGNVDIASTILSYFELQSNEMAGKVLINQQHEDSLDYITDLNRQVVNTSQFRYRVLHTFAIYQMIVSVLALLYIIFREKLSSKLKAYINFSLVSAIVAPFTLLVLPLLGVLSLTTTYLLLIIITFALVTTLQIISKKNPLNMLIYSTGLIVFGLLLDIILGQNLIKQSLFGYDPIIGARYYGIGNEYMGILIGSILLFTTSMVERYKVHSYNIMLFYLISVGIIGFPTLGANVGGTITAVFAFFFTSFRLSNQRVTFKKFIYIGITVIGVVSLLAIIDLFMIESQSHLAGAIEQVIARGPAVVIEIISRKVLMNIRIMGVTFWSRVLLLSVIILGILFYKPVGMIKKTAMEYPNISKGWSGILMACAIGFLVNDSGVVAAATSVIFLTTSMLYLIMNFDHF
ncbi:conserved hypothetical protein [Alkaliphilus metalliredigens QYMF]|uniref:Uncharacterized protein n=1 Tax=Alkaliphilus metalliredigens (strain QYMF) TaxID=293826 RepID=A6TQZ6_ALKMQ|nr:hypothetical protein [Alkaliphilus metalliredigens]ABR48614.1 conserved hypothetical protein [Alkaliphilus metalliredigens QYMF]